MYTLKGGVGVNELIKLTEVLKEHKGRWFTANEIGKKLDIKTFEAENRNKNFEFKIKFKEVMLEQFKEAFEKIYDSKAFL